MSANEGRSGKTTSFNFAVTLDRASAQTITVNFATANGTAIAGSDYNATSGTLTFTPGVTSRTITVRVIGDGTAESNETFAVNLSNAVNATIADAQGIGTIVNDDGSPTGPSKNLPIAGSVDPLAGGATILAGNSGADTFVLGDTSGSYYNQGKGKKPELQDFALIRGFNALEGDAIQLYGNALDYRSVTSSGSLPPGTAIYDRANELIGVVEGVTSLDLNSSAFRFVR
ncbi:Calx-beta domain-containing protein [Pannus brasiliensis CCIBt3594]|uniref:Calx-beta domain-containing protein n=1 Tax=Pannus brasiliensis CCIBt3594 TaxID=1427578 RepID=A0AAW9QTL4_9CHRO